MGREPELFDGLGGVHREHGGHADEEAPQPIGHEKNCGVRDTRHAQLRVGEHHDSEEGDPGAQRDRELVPLRFLVLQPTNCDCMKCGKAQCGPRQGEEEDPCRITRIDATQPRPRESRRNQQGPEPHDEIHRAGNDERRHEK
jgi:hypothetical protein